jgi:hypothetical protein
MPRNARIEAILAAWWEWERGDAADRPKSREKLDLLLDEARQGTVWGREQLLDHLWDHYLEFKRTRQSNQKLEDRQPGRD